MKLKFVADLAQDIAGIIGACLITEGTNMIYPPAAYIVAGLFILTSAWLAARQTS